MITVISSTNRTDSNTHHFAKHYAERLQAKTGDTVNLLDLNALDDWSLHGAMYTPDGQGASVTKVQDEWLIPSGKIVFVVPEYNGSFPGVLKVFLDSLSIRNSKETFHNTQALLVGVALGRAGNLRGLEHLGGILMHLGMTVHPNRLPISGIGRILDESKNVADEGTLNVIDGQIDAFLAF